MFLSWGWRKTGRYYILISSLCVPHSIYIHRHTLPEDSKHLQKLQDKVKVQKLMIMTSAHMDYQYKAANFSNELS